MIRGKWRRLKMPILPKLNNNRALTDIAQGYTERVKQAGISQGKTWKEWDDKWVKEWTTDPSKGDRKSFTYHNGQVYYPIWKSKSEYAQGQIDEQLKQYTDPNSDYYKAINKQISQAVSGAYSPNSLLALTVAMGGSPAQAQEQMKAMEGRVTATVSDLTNQYYLGASQQATSLIGMSMNNAQWQQQFRAQMEQYKQAKRDSWTNSLLGFGAQVAGYALAPATGGASLALPALANISKGYTAQD